MWKLVLVSIGAARALPSSLSSGDSLEPTLHALDDLDEDVQPVGDLLAVKRLGDGDEISVGGVGRKVGASPCRRSPRALRARPARGRDCGSPTHPTLAPQTKLHAHDKNSDAAHGAPVLNHDDGHEVRRRRRPRRAPPRRRAPADARAARPRWARQRRHAATPPLLRAPRPLGPLTAGPRPRPRPHHEPALTTAPAVPSRRASCRASSTWACR